MICGSLRMKEGVEKELELICNNYGLPSVSELTGSRQIVSDCY